MVQDGTDTGSEIGYIAHDGRTQPGVRSDRFPVFLGQLALLVEDSIRDADFANVVQ